MFIIVVGCGKMGATIANALSDQGESLIAIDKNEEAFKELSPDFGGFSMEGDATDVEFLKRAKIEQADMLLALSGDDNANLAISQIAKVIFNVPHVYARVTNTEREPIFQKLGINTNIPIKLACTQLLKDIEVIQKQPAGKGKK
ncbi:MAG: TrkA family potassium uptake protein [Firmicutes bacterium]|nr:TrkA family potassium uptake protein [Bacillota bacterium]